MEFNSPFFVSAQGRLSGVLRMLLYIRMFAVLVLLVCILYTVLVSGRITLGVAVMLHIFFCLLVLSALLWYLDKYKDNISQQALITTGLVADVFLLTEFIYFSGGASNPMTVLYLLPIIFAALFCTSRFAWILALCCSLIYVCLFFWYRSYYLFDQHSAQSFYTHLAGMWLTFMICALVMTGWICALKQFFKKQEGRLSQAYRKQQEDEYWLVLGMEAAGLAHELSTPMNNLMLLNEELRHHQHLPTDIKADVQLMETQLLQCKETLERLKDKSQSHAQEVSLYATLQERLKDWHNLRPQADCRWHGQHDQLPDYRVLMQESFWSAFFNILNNAADASEESIDLYTKMLPNSRWEVTIHNRHGFLSEEQLAKAGLDIIESNKPFGLGLGVCLAHATLSRLNGSLTLSNHPNGGVQAQIVLPLKMVNP